MAEIWKDVEGFEGYYQVSNFGNVKTVVRHDFKRNREIPEKIRKPICIHGYLYCDLWKDGEPKRFAVHRMVATAFLENPHGKREVNHIDGNKSNNHVSNLEWCTHSENENHAYKTKLTKPYDRSGDKNPMYGKHHSDDAKQRIKAVHVGLKHTEEARKKMSEAHKGKPFTKEHRVNLGKSLSSVKRGQRKMTNGNEVRFVLRDDIPQRLKEGWKFASKKRVK